MKKTLRKKECRLFYYLDPVNKKGRMSGPHERMTSDDHFEGLSEDCSYVFGHFEKGLVGPLSFEAVDEYGKKRTYYVVGDASGKSGRIHPGTYGLWTHIKGYIGNLRKLISGLSGDVSSLVFDDCTGWKGDCAEFFGIVPELTAEERKSEQNIRDAVIDDGEKED